VGQSGSLLANDALTIQEKSMIRCFDGVIKQASARQEGSMLMLIAPPPLSGLQDYQGPILTKSPPCAWLITTVVAALSP
jgi:hypothetical protein